MNRKLLFISCVFAGVVNAQDISITELGRFTDGSDGACEISTYDATSKQLFITNAANDAIDIVDVTNAASPNRTNSISLPAYGGGINSVVSLGNGYIAAAIEDTNKQANGHVAFYDVNGGLITNVSVGALPDMVTVTPDGNKVLVANEGEPNDDYNNDPKGSISIIDISGGISTLSQSDVTTLEFDAAPSTIAGSIQNPSTNFNVDLEPEYIAVSANSNEAAVICQESNVFIFLDLTTNTISSYKGLGFKDHSIAGNGFDASNRDDSINIQTWDVKGVYQPDAIASYTVGGNIYYLSANEGDARDYDGFSSETRIKSLMLDATAFPNASTLQADSLLGRLKTFTTDVIGDIDNDGDVDELYSYGARSFSIWDNDGDLVWDSGDDIEQYIAANHVDFFNCNDGLAAEQENRSDDKGPEPEAITVGEIAGKYYAFLGLERQGGIMVYDITDPNNPSFVTFVNSFRTDGTMTDIAPEGIVFVPASESHNGLNMLIVSNEVSGTTTIYQVNNLASTETEENVFSNLKFYPNPSNDLFFLEMENYGAEFTFSITNTLGTKEKVGTLTNSVNKIDVSNLAKGIYLLTVKDGNTNSNYSTKILKN